MAATALPTLAEVHAFTDDYLIDAARHWSRSANKWTDAFDRLTNHVIRPGGSDWMGEAAEAAALRVGTDRRRVLRAADELTAAAHVGRRAANDLHAAKTRLLSTVRAAEVAGFEVGEDFSLITVERTTSVQALAAREAQMRDFGFAIRSGVLALVEADETAARKIALTATRLRSMVFDDAEAAPDRTIIQTVDFHGIPLPEKPSYSPPTPPPGGWSEDPLMRAAQMMAYGHAWDKHRAEFPDIFSRARFADFIYQKMRRAITDPSGLRLGLAEDGAPVIYDPEDTVLIIRDTRPDTTQGGTAYKPQSNDPDYIRKKAPTEVRIFRPDDLADGSEIPSSSPPGTKRGSAEVPRRISQDSGGESPRTEPSQGGERIFLQTRRRKSMVH